jgi:hypothetical protein
VVYPDSFREPSNAGWIYRLPNGWQPSVINQAGRPFYFEIYLGSDDEAARISQTLNGDRGGLISDLTTDQVRNTIRQIADLPCRTGAPGSQQ